MAPNQPDPAAAVPAAPLEKVQPMVRVLRNLAARERQIGESYLDTAPETALAHLFTAGSIDAATDALEGQSADQDQEAAAGADTIRVDEANDKSELTITFTFLHERELILRRVQSELETQKSNASTALDALLDRIASLKAAAEAAPAPELREALAALAHDQWTGWMRYLFSRCELRAEGALIPKTSVNRWQHQMDTPYARLSEREKDSDRKEADRVLALLGEAAPAPDPGSETK